MHNFIKYKIRLKRKEKIKGIDFLNKSDNIFDISHVNLYKYIL